MRPQNLEKILEKIETKYSPNILIGFDSSDDAAVYKLSDSVAIVATVDFFAPIVDDPFDFGRIASANALSDVYAMGGTPKFALNIVAFPERLLPLEVLEKILNGAQSVTEEADITILGGHTIDDNEPKFGLAVIGIVAPDKVLKNSGAQIDDALILTKPLGTGILSTALKKELLQEDTKNLLVKTMSTLNKVASEVILEYPVNACTDVTGFGLLNHLHEMTSSSNVNATVNAPNVPIIPGTLEMYQLGAIPGGTKNNIAYAELHTNFAFDVPEYMKAILSDAQTSGGLLFSVPEQYSEKIIEKLYKREIQETSSIGKITEKGEGKIDIVT
jgi:selenide,water dikinase